MMNGCRTLEFIARHCRLCEIWALLSRRERRRYTACRDRYMLQDFMSEHPLARTLMARGVG